MNQGEMSMILQWVEETNPLQDHPFKTLSHRYYTVFTLVSTSVFELIQGDYSQPFPALIDQFVLPQLIFHELVYDLHFNTVLNPVEHLFSVVSAKEG